MAALVRSYLVVDLRDARQAGVCSTEDLEGRLLQANRFQLWEHRPIPDVIAA